MMPSPRLSFAAIIGGSRLILSCQARANLAPTSRRMTLSAASKKARALARLPPVNPPLDGVYRAASSSALRHGRSGFIRRGGPSL